MKFRKKSLWWVSGLSLVMFLTVSWVNQASAAGGDPPPPVPPVIGVSWMILIYAFMLTLFILIPTLTDICKAYKAQSANWTLIIEKLIETAGKDSLDKDELKALIEATSAGPPGISGMSRSLMAFAVLIILGIAVFHLLATQGANSEIVKNILSMLAATLASITGFYFGGKSAEQKAPGPPTTTGEDKEKEIAKKKAEEEEAKRKAEEEGRRELEGADTP
jgi:hypothetical protein